jgi:hypothetical protein
MTAITNKGTTERQATLAQAKTNANASFMSSIVESTKAAAESFMSTFRESDYWNKNVEVREKVKINGLTYLGEKEKIKRKKIEELMSKKCDVCEAIDNLPEILVYQDRNAEKTKEIDTCKLVRNKFQAELEKNKELQDKLDWEDFNGARIVQRAKVKNLECEIKAGGVYLMNSKEFNQL